MKRIKFNKNEDRIKMKRQQQVKKNSKNIQKTNEQTNQIKLRPK